MTQNPTPPQTPDPGYDPYAPPPKKGMSGLVIGLIVGGGVLVLGTCACAILIGIMLPALGKARQTALQLKSSSSMRQVITAMTTYADDNRSYYPPQSGWKDLLTDGGYLDPAVFDSFEDPDGDGETIVYVYAPRMTNDFRADRVVLYEDPDHFADGINAAFDDTHVATITRAELDAKLKEHAAELRDREERRGNTRP